MAKEFLKIAEKIENDIKNGTYNDTLPSIAALSQIFEVCSATIKRILSILRDRDLVSGEHGRCVRVNPKAAGNPDKKVSYTATLPEKAVKFAIKVYVYNKAGTLVRVSRDLAIDNPWVAF